jgi:serine/threonine protein kinase
MTHKSVEHPNIIKLQSFMRSEDLKYWFLILEYAPNGELFDIIGMPYIKITSWFSIVYTITEPDVGIEEDFAHFYFRQLISAVVFCNFPVVFGCYVYIKYGFLLEVSSQTGYRA